MNSLDIIVLVILSCLAIYGAVKGIVRLILGTGATMAGLFLGVWFNKEIASFLPDWIESDGARRLAAVALVMLATIILASVLIWLIQKLLSAVSLRWVDRVTGALLGLAVASFLVAAGMVPLAAFMPPDSDLIRNSRIAPYVLQVSNFLKGLVPRETKDRFDSARARLADARESVLSDGVELLKPEKEE
jgi:membrane protein required for colicin V production